jgi:hypothetical protein
MLESGSTMQDIKGVMIQGDATVFTDPESLLMISREQARWRGMSEDQLPTEPRPGAAYIKVTLRKVISWDYSRAG